MNRADELVKAASDEIERQIANTPMGSPDTMSDIAERILRARLLPVLEAGQAMRRANEENATPNCIGELYKGSKAWDEALSAAEKGLGVK